MQKRGQITVFIIIGLIILVVVGLFMLVGQESSFEQDLNEAEQNAKKAVQTYVENCLKEQLEDINQLVSLQGGYYQEPPYPSDYVVDRETFEIVQPYVPYVFNQGQKTFPTRVKVEEQLALGMKDNLYNCKDLSSLPYDASIRSEAGEVTASFLNTKVSVSVSLPIVLNVGNTVININQFSIEIPSKLPKLYEVAERITDEQVQRGMQLCLTCLSRTIEEHNVHLEMTEEGRETVHIITYTLSAPAGGDVFIFAHKFSLGGEISTLLLPPVEKLEATAGYPFTYELMAYGNGLTFYDDSELFDIDEHSGTITFSPTKEDVGSEIVIVRVMDEQGHIEEVSFVVEISDLTASEIEIDPLPYLTAFVGTPFTHFINVETDEQVYFSDDSNLFEIDVNTGEISFMPTSSKVGEHIFEVTVLDSSGNQNIVEGTLLVVE